MCSSNLGPGWNISPVGLQLISENDTVVDKNILLRNSLNSDLKDIGLPVLTKELSKSQISLLVLQIQKIRNVSAPKANEESQIAPRMLKLILTDGENYAPAIEITNISSISREKTPPGSKLLLQNVKILNGYIILNQENTTLLGGKVPHLFEKWELAKSVQHCSRPTVVSDGPPAWVDFGCEILASGDEIREFSVKSKDQPKDSSEFEVLRQGAIAEAATGAVKKVFGGGVKKFVQSDYKIDYNKVRNDSSKGHNKNKKEIKSARDDNDDKLQKPSDKVSLFDFLEDKLNITEISSDKQKFVEYNQDHNSKFANDVKKNSYKGYTNKKNFFQKNDYNNYSDRKYDIARDSGKDVLARHESNKTYQHYNSNWYDNKDISRGKGAQMDLKYASEHVQKESSFNKGLVTNKEQSGCHEHNTNKFNSIKEPKFVKDSNLLRNDLNSNPNNFSSSQRPYSKIESNEFQNQISRNTNRFSKIDEKKINDSWHYRAPEKTVNLNQNMSVQVDNITESVNKLSLNTNFASRTLRQHLNLNTRNSSTTLPQQKISQSNKNDDHKEWTIGDECLAKYWEDEKFYPARIIASTATTFVVQFKGYGNIEEILKTDCMSLKKRDRGEDKRQHKGTWEFRRNHEQPRPS